MRPVYAQQDPHLNFAHGGSADFRGRDGGIYNMLTASNISVNVRINAADFMLKNGEGTVNAPPGGTLVHGTHMKEVYVLAMGPTGKTTRVIITSDYAQPGETSKVHDGHRANARVIENGQETHYVGTWAAIHLGEGVSVFTREHTTIVSTPLWNVSVGVSPIYGGVTYLKGPWDTSPKEPLSKISLGFMLKAPEGSLAVAPHGVLGQSYDADNITIDGAKDQYNGAEFTTSAQAEGAIEGIYSDYEVASAFDTKFKFSRFGLQRARPRDVSALVGGTKGPRVASASAAALSDDTVVQRTTRGTWKTSSTGDDKTKSVLDDLQMTLEKAAQKAAKKVLV